MTAAAEKLNYAAVFKRAALAGLWFAFLTFPFIGMHVSEDNTDVLYYPGRALLVAVGVCLTAVFWQLAQHSKVRNPLAWRRKTPLTDKQRGIALLIMAVGLLVFPFVFSAYQVSILTTALLYVMLGLGLNIVVGLAGLLDLGYVAFFAVGAYSYALAHEYWGLGFWAVLPAAGALAALAGIVLGIPVLRLRGDYLAIVTLGFGEIIRLVLENWSSFTKGPAGIAGIPSPAAPIELSFTAKQIYLYFLVLLLTFATVLVVRRLGNSRLGRAWVALRDDEIACQASGIDKVRTKLSAFAMGAMWAGFVGVCFAAKNTYVNPGSFLFLHSAIILCIVVLGGMGSIFGVTIAALVITLVPEYLRGLSEYRMLAFGGLLVLMMIFRPTGFIVPHRPRYPDFSNTGADAEAKTSPTDGKDT